MPGEEPLLDVRREQQLAASRPEGARRDGAREALQPSPYDLYIGFQQVAALWACESDHEDELSYRCAFQAVEMGLCLLVDALREDRPAGRRAARVAALTDNVVQQVDLARRLLAGRALPPAAMVEAPADSPGVQALARLGPEHRDVLRRITDAVLTAEFPVPLGIEPDLAALRAAQGLPPRDVPAGPFLPYARWVQPDRVAALVHKDEHSPEDRLFATVHQMTECWLRLVLDRYARAELLARERGDWDGAAAHLEQAGTILEFLARHIELLHLMVVADYHPLRVALRGASGAQSAAARVATISARHLLPPLLRDLEARGIAALDVVRFPHDHPGAHRYLEACSTLERRLMAFYFQHFQLARKVLGTKSLGSLGYEVRALAERFTKPLFTELDEARFDHTMLTNLEHGGRAGTIIAEREAELVLPAPPPSAQAPPPEVARATLERYFAAIRALDLEAWVALFHPEGTMEDPVGSRPHRGTAELRVFFQGVQRTFAGLDVQAVGPLDFKGSRATARWQARGTAYNGRAVAFEGTEVFDLAPDGAILAVRVWWDPAVLVDQLLGAEPSAAAPAAPA